MHAIDHRIETIRNSIEPSRQALLSHPVYQKIDCVERLRTFMEHHVFAVWDFMSLLKALQQRFAPTEVPWLPPANRVAARMVNEIVTAEESDEDARGKFASHFDLYHQAMTKCGADTGPMDRLLENLAQTRCVETALQQSSILPAIREFVRSTFAFIEEGDPCAIASAFTFGREDLLPDVFQEIVNQLSVAPTSGLEEFQYYLSRHIELDADEHGPMALQLIAELCGDDEARWAKAESAALETLNARRALWDAVLEQYADANAA